MPKTWSDKRERQYEHIKEGLVERGRAPKDASSIAARTVNKGARAPRRVRGREPRVVAQTSRRRDVEVFAHTKVRGARRNSSSTARPGVATSRVAPP